MIAMKAESVLCCRVSPGQKQQIVKLVKTNNLTARTLSIGDGGNDVNMITEAHVGVGIKGLEGQQAVRASDYAIAEFRFLRRLLFVHGRESYRKNSQLVLFSYYKNMLLISPQFWYTIIVGNLSGVSILNDFLFQFANLIYTVLPISVYAIFDRECDPSLLELSPKYYLQGIKKSLLNNLQFWRWVILAVVQGLIIFSFCSLLNASPQTNGQTVGFYEFGIFVFSMGVFVLNMRIYTFTSSYSLFMVFSINIGTVLHQLMFLAISYRPQDDNYMLFTKYNVCNSRLWSNPNSWLICLLIYVSIIHVEKMVYTMESSID